MKTDMEPCEFLVAFRRATAVTPDQYLMNVLVDRSRTLLATTELSVPEISERAGFDDDEFFGKLFAARVRCSPAAFRTRTG